jgi:cation diffusion facilitator family transporter
MFHRCIFFGANNLKKVPIREIIITAQAAETGGSFMTAKKTSEDISVQTNNRESSIIRQLSLVGIIGNILLAAFKMFAGIAGKSGAMISDAVHSLSDVFATFIAFLGVKLSQKAADQNHPYGHERLECVASLILGAILLLTGLGIGKVGVEKIIAGNYESLAVPGTIALAAAIVSIAVKEAMYWYTRHYAKILNSSAFMADAWHHRSDAFSSVGSLIGIGGAMLGFPVLDSVASVIICLFILKVAFDILKDALSKMLDTSCGEAYDQKLTDYIAAQEGVVHVDVLHSRMFGNKVYIDLEIAVDGDKSLKDAHAVAQRVHDNVEKDFPNVKHVMIHLNPAE